MSLDAPLIEQLRAEIDAVIRPLLGSARGVALLDFPNHANVGDSAIWLGERNYLRSIGMTVSYTCDLRSYSEQALRRSLRDSGVILLHGGGNLGDLWVRHQRFRERVVAAFPSHRIIQLPQSICFRDRRNLAVARTRLRAHPDFQLLVRDHRSMRAAREELGVGARLCPDMAFWLGPLTAGPAPTTELVWLARTDKERQHPAPERSPGVEARDWLEDDTAPSLRLQAGLRLVARRLPRLRSWVGRLGALCLFDELARTRLGRGCRMLCSARHVVTDRLHGHILCMLLGISHDLMDNCYGKNRSFHQTWTTTSRLTRWSDHLQTTLRRLRLPPDGQDGGSGAERPVESILADPPNSTSNQARSRDAWPRQRPKTSVISD